MTFEIGQGFALGAPPVAGTMEGKGRDEYH